MLRSESVVPPTNSEFSRTLMISPRRLPDLSLDDGSGSEVSLSSLTGSRPFLLNLWQHTCLPCLEELREFAQSSAEIRRAGLDIVAVHLSTPGSDEGDERAAARKALFRNRLSLQYHDRNCSDDRRTRAVSAVSIAKASGNRVPD